MKRSVKTINEYTRFAVWFIQHGQGDKFKYALKKVIKKTNEASEKHNDKVEDLRIGKASVDEKGNLILGEKGEYSFTPANLKALKAEIKKLELECKYEIEPQLASAIPDLNEEQIEAFRGFVIPEDYKNPEVSKFNFCVEFEFTEEQKQYIIKDLADKFSELGASKVYEVKEYDVVSTPVEQPVMEVSHEESHNE